MGQCDNEIGFTAEELSIAFVYISAYFGSKNDH